MENPLKDCLTKQVSKEDVNNPDFDLSNYVNKKIKETWFEKAIIGINNEERNNYGKNSERV